MNNHPTLKNFSMHSAAAMLSAAFMLYGCSSAHAMVAPEDAARILPVSQVKAGMQGYGLTVFQGDTIERFDVKVVGVMPNMNFGRPLILVKVGGGQLNKRGINIAEGMSGSPVYIGGRIIGAIAYAGSFAREALGLVTPIEDMLGAWNPSAPSQGPVPAEPVPLQEPVMMGGSTMTSVTIQPAGSGDIPVAEDCGVFRPMATPLIASGLSPRSITRLAETLAHAPVSVRPGPGRIMREGAELKEGAAVGFSLVTGDVDLTAVGTVTYARGGRILAFGHPFLSSGPVELPMSTAWVHDVFPSYAISYKMASPLKIVGSSSQDQPFAVAGETGRRARMVPVEVTLKDDASPAATRLQAQVLRHRLYTPVLTQMVVSEALVRKRPYPGEAMARVTMSVTGEGIGTVERSNLFFSPVDITTAAMNDLEALLALFQTNKFRPVEIEKVSLEVDIYQARNTADVESLRIDQTVYEPGDTIQLTVQMRPFGEMPIYKKVEIGIPETAMDGGALLAVYGGSGPSDRAAAGAAGVVLTAARGGASDELREAANLQQLMQKFQELNTNDQLVARLLLPSASFNIDGRKHQGLPPSMENAIQSSKATGIQLVRDDVKVASCTDWFVSGAQMIPLTVRRKTYAEEPEKRPAATAKPAAPTSGSASEGSSSTDEDEKTEIEIKGVGTVLLFRMAEGATAAEKVKVTESAVSSGDSDEKEADSSGKSESTSGPKVSGLGRSTLTWLQSSAGDFLKGKMQGACVTSDGALQLGVEADPLASFDEPYVWSVAPGPDGSIIAGTGNKGQVLEVSRQGQRRVLFETGGTQVSSVLRDVKGRIWAGSSPDGSLWVFEDGEARRAANLQTKHIAALACASGGAIYAAAGDSGRIWQVTDSGAVTLVADTGQRHTQCLTVAESGVLYAGTASAAAVWHIQDGKCTSIFRADEEYVHSIAIGEAGLVYASTGPGGRIYRIPQGGSAETLGSKLISPTVPLVQDEDGTILAADREKIYRIMPEDRLTSQPLEDPIEIYCTALLPDGVIAAGQNNPGAVLRLARSTSGWYMSPVHDAGRPATWGAMRAEAGGSTSGLTLKVRTGNVQEPDDSWSGWRTLRNGDSAGFNATRFIQYRVELSRADSGAPTADLNEVAVSYLPANRRPTVSFTSPGAGAAWSGEQEVKWSGSDPDKDKLTYELFYSGDEGKTWKPLTTSSNSSSSRGETKTNGGKAADSAKTEPVEASPGEDITESDREKMLEDIKKEVRERDDLPDEIKNQILKATPDMLRGVIPASGSPGRSESKDREDNADSTPTSSTSHKWKTSDIADGRYLLKITASDVLANGPESLSDEAQVGPIPIVNTKPRVMLLSEAAEAGPGGTRKLSGIASSTIAPVAAVQYRISPAKDWVSARPSDGIFDGTSESFDIYPRGLKPGKHTVEMQVKDTAENTATGSRDIDLKE